MFLQLEFKTGGIRVESHFEVFENFGGRTNDCGAATDP